MEAILYAPIMAAILDFKVAAIENLFPSICQKLNQLDSWF